MSKQSNLKRTFLLTLFTLGAIGYALQRSVGDHRDQSRWVRDDLVLTEKEMMGGVQ